MQNNFIDLERNYYKNIFCHSKTIGEVNNKRQYYADEFCNSNKGKQVTENLSNNLDILTNTCPCNNNPNWYATDSLPMHFEDKHIIDDNDSYCYLEKDNNQSKSDETNTKISVDNTNTDSKSDEICVVKNNKTNAFNIIKIDGKLKIHVDNIILDKSVFVNAEKITEQTTSNSELPMQNNKAITNVNICYNGNNIVINNIDVATIVDIYNELNANST